MLEMQKIITIFVSLKAFVYERALKASEIDTYTTNFIYLLQL